MADPSTLPTLLTNLPYFFRPDTLLLHGSLMISLVKYVYHLNRRLCKGILTVSCDFSYEK